ncbi:MAG TPA: alpha/beta fold hydrolase, partial [Acidobacteriaceae bacterium]
MPWLETILILLVTLNALVAFVTHPRRSAVIALSALALLTCVAHALCEGLHWQMGPAYLALLISFTLGFASVTLIRRLISLACITLALVACAFSIYLPIFHLPPPTGSYAIGTQIISLVNPAPKAPGAAEANGQRALMIQLWYPASPSRQPIAPYRILKETTRLSSYQSVTPTHARWNAPSAAAGAPFPILLLNPAWNGRRTYYMYLVEELVSHGYIVVGIDHTGNSGPTAFPDGHVNQPDPDPGLDFEAHSYDEVNAYGARVQKIQVEDDQFVLDQLAAWNQQPGNFYQNRLDLARVGAFGHSFGGSVSAELCRIDPRVKSALDMDGSFWPPVQNNGLAKPLMMIEEDYAQFTPDDLKKNHADAIEYAFDQSDDRTMANSNGYRAVLHGSSHVSYTDRSLFSPFQRESGVGAIPGLREYAIIRSYALAFFNKTLNGVDSPILSSSYRGFPEATFTILRRPAEPISPQDRNM